MARGKFWNADISRTFIVNTYNSRFHFLKKDHPGENYQARNNCKVCGRFNATHFMLKMHMTRMHSNMPKTFKCNENGCEKTFRVSNQVENSTMYDLTDSTDIFVNESFLPFCAKGTLN